MKLTDKQKQFLDKITIDADMNRAPLNSKVERVICVHSVGCAAIALMPIPFADFPYGAYPPSDPSKRRHIQFR